MGVPKFFRYISERYPCLSEVVREYQIPEFDNLYLDMNGIIHMCSHPDDENVHFRISEEKIFSDIFHYIEVLFRMIKPQKVFFMAVDGVAPRAKMNQQRGRRFRSAKDAEKRNANAVKKGEKLPDEAAFDSNCITPGTVFMARLHEQLQYFVVDKVSNDAMWQKCKIILSGHETPGEGEHKIMDYIRYMRCQPGYDPNTRHCLYGLDADLIMLGLCTHEPHFSLLREEVKFGRKSTKRISAPEEIPFFLLHLSLMREYLELEFVPLKNKLRGFHYDLEKIIDDWVLMGFLVGNDFIPHLPNLHIANGALPILYKAYMEILPTLDGYINEGGTLHLVRFERFMEKLSEIDVANFEEVRDDLLYMEAKTGRKHTAHTKVSTNPLADGHTDSALAALIREADEMCAESDTDDENYSEEDEAFSNYKKEYYQNKLEYSSVTPKVLRDQAEGYVRAIQWNLHYYYNGCCSWSWFYPHHYAPYISDIRGFLNSEMKFNFGKPFLPFEQLLAVLPPASKDLLPICYHKLMMEENSLISQYYPEDFQTDLNGKKQEWEAVVLVPFIDEKLLLEAMAYCNDKLSDEEKGRNSHGPMLIYTYTPKDMGVYEAPEHFPPVIHDHTDVQKLMYHDILVPKEKLIKGAYPGAKMNVFYPGFPTMKHLKYKAELKRAKIKVFESPSRNENMIITIRPDEKFSGELIPADLLGTTVFVGWPHLTEAKVVAISNSRKKYVSMGGQGQYNVEERTHQAISQFKSEIEGITQFYEKRLGIDVGPTKVLVHVQVLTGRRYSFLPNGKVVFEKQFAPNTSNYPLQATVFNIEAHDSVRNAERDIGHIFPRNGVCFTLTNPYYGSQGIVQENLFKKSGRIKICVSVLEEPDFTIVKEMQWKLRNNFKTLHNVASQLSVSNILFSRMTGTIFVTVPTGDGSTKNTNMGLDLKLNKRNKETPGYTKKIGTTWCYTDKAAELVGEYCEKFPAVIEYLVLDSSFDDIAVEKLFGDDWEDKLKDLQKWLKSLPVYTLERQTCGSEVLEKEIIEEIEDAVGNFQSGNIKKVTMQIKPNFLYTPEIQSGTLIPDPKSDTKLLDRIVNVRQGYTVPFGLKGTVVGIQLSQTESDRDVMYDVIFDKPFKGGMKIGCLENRAYRIPKNSYIDITYGQRLLEEKIGKPDELIARAEASHNHHQFNKQNYPNNIAPPANPLWFPPRQQYPYNTHFPSQPNSAFAQFASEQTPGNTYEGQRYHSQYNVQNPPFYQNYTQGNQHHRPQIYNQQNYSQQSAGQSQNVFRYIPSSQDAEKWENHEQYHANRHNSGSQVPAVKQPQNKDFLPKFAGTNGNAGQERVEKEEKQSSKPRSKPAPRNLDSNTSRPAVNTEFLRNVLGINKPSRADGASSSSSGRTRQVPDQDVKPAASQKSEVSRDKENLPLRGTRKVEATKNSFNITFDTLAHIASAPASVKLLTYFQSNGLGLPRYQYFQCGVQTQAQIKLPDGNVMTGKLAASREEASENVAADVLELWIKKGNSSTEKSNNNDDIPTPPKSWVEPDNVQAQASTSKVPAVEPQSAARSNTTKTEAKPTLNKSFVPLQVVKKQIVKSGSNQDCAKIEKKEEERNDAEVAHVIDKMSAVEVEKETKKAGHKPKKERKTRIAANFQKKD